MATMQESALSYLDSCREEMLRLWETIVRLETPSTDAAAVSRLASHLDTYCDALGMMTEKFQPQGAGLCLAARTPSASLPPVLLLGHLDTVHPAGSFPGGPWRVEGDTVCGPGVHDCKGGLVIALYVVRALLHAGYDRRQLRLVLLSDEETAHTLSQRQTVDFLQRQAMGCGAAFTVESGLPDGQIITARKGGGILPLRVQGIASHAGTAPEKGASAVLEAARKIVAIHALSDPAHVTYNCGIIHGGTSANVVPDRCEVSVAIRFRTNQDHRQAMDALHEICGRVETPGTSCTLGPLVGFPAMEELPRTATLAKIYQDASEALGLGRPGTAYSAGCSDSAYTASMGIPTLCAVGVLGEGQHSPHEHADLSSLLPQAKRLANAILSLPDDF